MWEWKHTMRYPVWMKAESFNEVFQCYCKSFTGEDVLYLGVFQS